MNKTEKAATMYQVRPGQTQEGLESIVSVSGVFLFMCILQNDYML